MRMDRLAEIAIRVRVQALQSHVCIWGPGNKAEQDAE